MANIKVRRPALKYFGGKWRIAPWIISHFPEHSCYVEPFGGAGSVLFRKEPSRFEVYNDINKEVVNFFRVLRDSAPELLRLISLTPFSRTEAQSAYTINGDSDLERARKFYVRSYQVMSGGGTIKGSGWRFSLGRRDGRGEHRSSIEEWGNIGHLTCVAERLLQIQIECDDAFTIISRYDAGTTLFYCDPPYLPDTRSKRWRDKGYEHEMTPKDHERLADTLNEIKGMAIVSGYPSSLYESLYKGWVKVEKEARCDGGGTKKCPTIVRRTEVLWISPNAVSQYNKGLFSAKSS